MADYVSRVTFTLNVFCCCLFLNKIHWLRTGKCIVVHCTISSFDVSKPYRMHCPPYIHCRGAAARLGTELSSSPKAEAKDSDCESSQKAAKRPKSPEPEEGSFSVRRSRRLASFPSRFAKRMRVNCSRTEPSVGQLSEEENAVKHPPAEPPSDSSRKSGSHKASEARNPCCSDGKT